MYGYDIMPCHRLDRNTSGLTLFAKNKDALDILFSKFKTHEIEKHYLCRVYGIPKEKHKVLEAYLFKDSKKSLVYISDSPKKGYQKIVTEYFVRSSNKSNNTSVLEIILHTVELIKLELIYLILATQLLVMVSMALMKLIKNLIHMHKSFVAIS